MDLNQFAWSTGSSGIPNGDAETDPSSEEGGNLGGGAGIRTPDPLLAKQVLSRLSYTP